MEHETNRRFGDRRSHLSSISRCPAVRASSVSPPEKNCESVSPNASQIFSSEENEGVMPFWYQDEMVDCGRPERSAS